MAKKLRVGVMTGGGDCPGLNAVIRAVTKSLLIHHQAEVIGFMDGYLGLIERRIRPLTYSDVSGILTRGGTILGTNNRANPFSYYGRNGENVVPELVDYYNELGLDGIVAIGGDGTMSIGHGLQQAGINIVGVPKTIDNDLMHTERTFGFDTAVSVATEALDRLHTTAQSHHRVMILETMGRYAGWIALHAGVAGGADVILIPEFDYEIEEVARVCLEREEKGQRFTLIAIAEGAKPKGGKMAVREIVEGSTDPIRLGGISDVLRQDLEKLVTNEVRTSVLGYIQRGGAPTPFDRTLATAMGSYAAALAAEGKYGRMVAIQNNRLTTVDLKDVANQVRKVPNDSPLIAAAIAVGTSFGVSNFDVEFGAQGSPRSIM